MEFRTQKDLLEHLGKNPNDRKLVSRMIIRGEVYKKSWWYVLANKDAIISELNKKLEDYDQLVEKVNKLSSENSRLLREKNELIQQMIDKWSSGDKDEIINKVYKYLIQVAHIQVDKTEFKEWLESTN